MSITDPSEPLFGGGSWGWHGTQWRRAPLPWGYYDSWRDTYYGTLSAGGMFYFYTTAVPSGYVYVLERASLHNDSGARGWMYIGLKTAGIIHIMAYFVPSTSYEPITLQGPMTVVQGEQIVFFQDAVVAGDTMRAIATGYKLKLDE